MGTFGVGLYSGDMAMDLRAAVSAVLRLPLDEDRLVDILCEAEPAAASDPANEDHATFWLVLADQFAKKGVASGRVRETALAIIDSGADLAMLERLGMTPADLRKRAELLREVRARVAAAPDASAPRTVLKGPQPYALDLGGLYAYPVDHGEPVNPYAGPSHFARHPFVADGFALMLIVRRDRSFGYLTWYLPLTATTVLADLPAAGAVPPGLGWRLRTPGTCSALHMRKLRLQRIAVLPLDDAKLQACFPWRRKGISHYGWDGRSAAVNDISIANRMTIASAKPQGQRPIERPGDAAIIAELSEILADEAREPSISQGD